MKKIIKEQNMGSDLIGKTVNWYVDVENKKNAASGKIISIDTKSRNNMKYYVITVTAQEIGKSKPVTLRLRFHCYGFTQDTLIDPKYKKAFVVLGPGDKEVGLMYNDNLYDGLAKKFCSVSKGGVLVPGADFASVGTEKGEPMAEGKKVIRLTESDLVRLVKKVISEQNTQQDYKQIADYLHSKMKGLNNAKDAEDIETTISNRIKNMNDWEGVKKAFGERDGINLEGWINAEWNLNLKKILKRIKDIDTKYREEDLKYNPGSKIRLITNRQFIMGRAYNYASTMGDKDELEVDINDAVVVKRDKDAIVVKAPYVSYYNVSERKRGEYPKSETMTNVCIRIPFSEIIEWRDDSLQVRWFSNSVKSRVVTC